MKKYLLGPDTKNFYICNKAGNY